MFCVQCGFELEDDYQFCPRCGVSVFGSRQTDPHAEIEKLADEIHECYPKSKKRATKMLCERTGLSPHEAESIMNPRYMQYEMEMEWRKAERQAARRKLYEIEKHEKEMCRQMKRMERKNKVVRCPKCRSASISYAPRPSWGRAFVGYGLAGDAGAVIGGMTGKKGYAVCLNCGKTWKI